MGNEMMTYQGQMEQQRSLIENVDMGNLQQIMSKISAMQKFVQENLRQNHDYGIIPGTSKPTLLKPGAEKLLMLYGLQSRFEIIECASEEDFVEYTFRCVLSRQGNEITEGYGSCNSKEAKYKKQDPYNIKNTILKMAKKRALIDAALTVSSLSDIFTQDLEDMDLEGVAVEESNAYKGINFEGTITQKQVKLLWAKAHANSNVQANDLINRMLEKYGYDKIQNIEKAKLDEIIEWMAQAS